MSTELRIPKIGMGMTEGKLIEWLAADGDSIEAGSVIYSLETDKTVTEIEAPVGGVLRIEGQIDETYDVGTLIGRIE